MGVRGQISMEYLIITAVALLLLIPIIIIAATESSSFQVDVSAAQIEKVANEIVSAANEVYYTGSPAKRTLKLYFPEGIKSAAIVGKEIIFNMTGSKQQYEYALAAEGNLTGNLQNYAGLHKITVTAGINEVTITDG